MTFNVKYLLKKLNSVYVKLCVISGGTALISYAVAKENLHAASECVEPAYFPWPHNGIISSFDHASIRRGYQVYKEVCSACHSMRFIAYRHLVGVSHTEAEAKAEAAEALIDDGPNEKGEMYKRPGKLSDNFPKPYPNEVVAKLANNGTAPPDLSLMSIARDRGIDYIFSLLTGYQDPPAGVEEKEDLNYNPYFPGSFTAMKPPLYDDIIEYKDGTPTTISQMAKDVCCFLAWTAQMEHDTRKLYFIKAVFIMTILTAVVGHYKRWKWMTMKTRKLMYVPPPPKYKNL